MGEGSETDLTPDEGLAYMLALNIANNVWEEVMGERLTVVHGYSRNAEQRDGETDNAALISLTDPTK